tara:strand:+ start:1434 stop:1970 length:537 start_codon:yes stop_codon:yes gene_type:complete
MKKKLTEFLDIFLRYLILVLIALPGLWIFYFVFAPLTIYPIYLILGLFLDVALLGNIILINNEIPIEIIDACIAGSAYYLLLILNLSTPKIDLKKRVKIIFISFASLLFVNILRILILILIFMYGFAFFDITHQFFWYFVSTIFVIGIWFVEVKMFKIKEIPFYSDLRFLYRSSKSKR